MRLWRNLPVAGLPLVIAVFAPRAPRAQEPADLALVNGRVLTVDAADSIAQAVG